MVDLEQQIEKLAINVQKLVHLNQSLQKQNVLLEKEIVQLKSEINYHKNQINKLRKTTEDTINRTELKKQISEVMEEVEYCLKMLAVK